MKRNEYDEAVWASDMPTNAKIVALCYAKHSHWDTGDGIYVSQVAVADQTRLSKNTVSKWMEWLEAEGWLEVTGTRKNNVKVHALSVPEVSQRLGDLEEAPEEGASQPLGNQEVQVSRFKSQACQSTKQVSQPLSQVSQRLSTNVTDLTENFTENVTLDESDDSSGKAEESSDREGSEEGAGTVETPPIQENAPPLEADGFIFKVKMAWDGTFLYLRRYWDIEDRYLCAAKELALDPSWEPGRFETVTQRIKHAYLCASGQDAELKAAL